MEEALKIIGRNIARLREARGLSQKQLADLIDLDVLHLGQSYLSKLEHGKKNVTVGTLVVVAKALNVSLVELVSDKE